MAKTIKFNLICDNYPVRTIEDLQEHFNVEDVYGYYENRLLHKWLKVRGYDEQLKKVEEITVSDAIEVLKELIKIFEILACEEGDLKIWQFEQNYKERKKSVHSDDKDVIKKYIDGYKELIQGIESSSDDMEMIKVHLEVIMRDYDWMFKRDYRNIFYECYANEAWLTIICFLMNEEIREYMFKKKNGDFQDEDRKAMLEACRIIESNYNIRDQLKKYYKCVTNLNTQEEWYRLEPEGKKYMILHMTGGSYIKLDGDKTEERVDTLVSAGVVGRMMQVKFIGEKKQLSELVGTLDCTEVNGKFPIVDGILYKSNSTMNSLYYMEV